MVKKANWQIKKLGEVCEIGAGNSAPQNKELFENGSYPFFRTSDVGKIHFGLVEESADKLNNKGIRKLKIHKKGSLLFPKSGASTFLNHRVLMGVNGYVSSHLAILKADNDRLEDRFLLYFSMTVDSRNLMQDQNYPSLRLSDIQEIKIPLPPLPVQRLLVKKLDKILADIEKIKQNAGKNLQNARELFESYLQSVFSKAGEGWEGKKLGQIATVEYGFTDKAKNEGNYRFIRITDIDKNGCLISEDKMYIKSTKEAGKYILNDDDLLMARTGATFAKVLLYKNIEKSVFASYLIRIKFMEDIQNKLYWYFSKTKLYWDQANKLSSGSAQPQFNGAALKEIVFNYPKSITKQKRIVKKFNALAGETKKLEAIYQKKLADLEELKKSVLKKAFAGEL